MNILHIVGGLPSEEKPHYQPFIKAQIDSLSAKGLNIETLDLKGYKSPLNYITSGKLIRRIVKEKNIQIIHAHYAYCGLSAILAGTKLPLVLSLMGSDLLGSANTKGNITLRGYFDRLFTRIISNFPARIIVKSDKMKAQLSSKKNIDVIPNGVNFDLFKPLNLRNSRSELELNMDNFLILFLGNPDLKRKNFKLASQAADILIKESGAKNIELINPFGISHNEITKYMNACDVLLLTSYWEGSPNVVKEAMACNLPVISTDVGDVSEIISGTKNCFIVPYDEGVITKKLKIVYDNRERSDGRERIQHLREDIIAERIIEIYRSVLNERME
jgi:teichuronic acid biosynthesis glycosyltransferase TuaC